MTDRRAIVRLTDGTFAELPLGDMLLGAPNGWSPIYATVEDGERRVDQVVDWVGGSGTKPDVDLYKGPDGLVPDIADGTDVRGPAGQDGANGTGWGVVPYGGYAAAFTDLNGQTVLRFTYEKFEHPEIDSFRDRLDASSPALYAGGGVGGLAYVDLANYLQWQLTPNRIIHPEADVWREDNRRARIPTRDPALAAQQAWAKVLGFYGYGQSKEVGYDSYPEVTNVTLPYARKFAGGVRSIDSGINPAVAFADIRPFCSQRGGKIRNPLFPTTESTTGNLGETQMGGALRMIAQLLRDEDGIDIDAGTGQLFLGAVNGHSGTGIRGLSPDSITGPSPEPWAQYYYNDLLDTVTYGKSLVEAAGMTWQPLGLGFDQGEADTSGSTTLSQYKSRLIALQAKFEADVQAISGVAAPLPWVINQPCTFPHYAGTTAVALAQYEACRDLAAFGFGCAQYMLPYNPDNVHLPALGSLISGLYRGLAWKRRHFDGVKHGMVRPASFQRHGKVIIADYECPGERLVLDSRYTAPAGVANYGITIVASGGGAVTVSSVEQVSRKRLRITCATDPGANCKFGHALVGDAEHAKGGVRDDQGDRIIFEDSNLRIPVHNWSPILEEVVA